MYKNGRVEMIKAEEYNKKLDELGYVVRNVFGKWCVCDGKAPSGIMVEKNSLFCGYIVKRFDTFDEANELRAILNK